MDVQLAKVTLTNPMFSSMLDESIEVASPDELFNLILELDAFFSIMAIIMVI